jgi:hypothetical protein
MVTINAFSLSRKRSFIHGIILRLGATFSQDSKIATNDPEAIPEGAKSEFNFEQTQPGPGGNYAQS